MGKVTFILLHELHGVCGDLALKMELLSTQHPLQHPTVKPSSSIDYDWMEHDRLDKSGDAA